MFPTGYAFSSPGSESTSGLFGLSNTLISPAIVSNPQLGLHGLVAQLPQGNLQSFLHGSLRGMNLGVALPMMGGAGSINPQGLSMDMLTQLSSASLNPILYVPTAINQASLTSNVPTEPSSAHTIVRAPVLYKTSTNAGGESVTTTTKTDSKSTEQSPPDRIVASYAAAAHAAALACHQPISKAAEVFLAATLTGRSRHPKRLRNRAATTTAMTTTTMTATEPAISASSSVPTSVAVRTPSLPSTDKNSDLVHKGWRRIVDRTANSVVYISQDGKRFVNMTEVIDYFGAQYPDFLANKTYRDLLMSCFSFEPTVEAPLFEEGLSFLAALQPSTQTNSSDSCHDSTFPLTSSTTTSPSHINGETLSTRSSSSDMPVSTSVPCRISFNPNRLDNGDPNSTKRPKLTLSSPSHTEVNVETPFTASVSSSSLTLPSIGTKSDAVPTDAISPADSGEVTTTTDAVLVSTHLSAEQNKSDNESSQNTATQPEASTTSPVSCQSDSSTTPSGDTDTKAPEPASPIVSEAVYPNRSAENSVAKLTTETVTTGVLHANLTSSSLSVMPSVVSPAKQSTHRTSTDPIAMALSNLINNQANPNLLALQANAEQANLSHSLAMGQLINNVRLAQFHQQQQLAAAAAAQLNALSSSQLTGHPLAAMLPSGTLVAQQNLADVGQNQLNNWIVAAQNAQHIIDNPSSAASNQLAALQQQLLLANALQSQQSLNPQATLLAQAASLVQQQQQQQQALAAQAQQQQQQQLLSASPFAQAYLAAVQQQLGNMPRW